MSRNSNKNSTSICCQSNSHLSSNQSLTTNPCMREYLYICTNLQYIHRRLDDLSFEVLRQDATTKAVALSNASSVATTTG